MTPKELLAERRLCLPTAQEQRDRELIGLLLDACDEDDAKEAIEVAYADPRPARVLAKGA